MSLVSELELKNCKLLVENIQTVENTHLIKLNQSITPMDAYPDTKKYLHASQKSSSKKNSSKKTKKNQNKREAIVLGFGSKHPLKQQLTLACFIGPLCMVVL